MALSNKQRAFVEHYLVGWNATEAARRAGYSPRTAQEQGSRLLSKVIVKSEIAARITQLKATTDEVLLRLAAHSRGSMEHFLRGDAIDLEQARERGLMHLVKKFKVTTTTIVDKDGDGVETHRLEIELYDAQAATVQLAKILGQYVEHIHITTWQDDVIALLRDKKIAPEVVIEELGYDLATELFNSAGIPVSQG